MTNFLRRISFAAWFGGLFLLALLNLCGGVRAEQATSAVPSAWRSPSWAGNARLEAAGPEGFRLSLPQGRPWAAAVQAVEVNVMETPILSVSVRALSPGASWLLKLDNAPYDQNHPHDVATTPAGSDAPGRFLIDLPEVSGGAWRDRQHLDVRLFVTGPPGAWVEFGPVFTVANHRTTVSRNVGTLQVAAGAWTLQYVPESKGLRLCRAGETDGVAVSLPGLRDAARAPEIRRVDEGPDRGALILQTATDSMAYEAKVSAYPLSDGLALFRWTVEARWLKDGPPPDASAMECRYDRGSEEGLPLRVLSVHRFGQSGLETGQAFLPRDAALGASALYVQNLTSLGPLFDVTHASASKTVGGDADSFGFHLPSPLPGNSPPVIKAGTRLKLTDAFLALTNDDAASPEDRCRVYLDLLATIYTALPKPPTVYTDWQQVAKKSLSDLMDPACWSNTESGYLRNYVNEPWPPQLGELTVQVDPLVASLRYEKTWSLPQSAVTRRIVPSLPDFYLSTLNCIRDYTSEDHPTKSDSWYRVYPLIQLAHAAEMGVPQARTLVQNSLDATIALARKCDYRFPVFYNPQTLSDFVGAEPDCGGAYAYLMLQAHQLFGDARFLDEARRSLAPIRAHGLNYAYELHLTALSVVACARMWKATGDADYLDLSLAPLANVLRHCWLYEPGYGFHKDHHLFFALSAMAGTYTAPFEQYQAWLALREYDDIAHDALPPSAQLLVSEFLKYGQTNLRFMYPSFMAAGAVAPRNERGMPNDLSLLIPVEDVNDGWTTSGHIGQELYGSGGPLALAARTYTLVPEAGLSVYSEYPVREAVWNWERHILRLRLGGVRGNVALVSVRYDALRTGWKTPPHVQVVGAKSVSDRHDEPGQVRFRVPGEAVLLIDTAPARKVKTSKGVSAGAASGATL